MAKIIDQKGKVFGLINVIDLSVILILLSFAPLIFIGYKIIGQTKEKEMRDKKSVTIKIKLAEVEPEFISIVSKGDVERDSLGNKIGELIAISSIKPSKVWVIVDNKMLATIDHPVKKDIIVDVRVSCTKNKGVLYYKSDPVKIGNAIVLSTDIYNLSGLVVGFKADDKN